MLRWRCAPGCTSVPGDEEVIAQLLDNLDAKPVTRFEASVALMKQMQPTSNPATLPGDSLPGLKDIWKVKVHDASETLYLVNRRERRVMESDVSMTRIVEAKMDYRTKIIVKLEGKQYSKGDFQIRPATATQTITGTSGQQVFLGHVLELEYTPLSNLEMAFPLMQEFVSMLNDHIPHAKVQQVDQPLGSLELIQPSYEKYIGLPKSFGLMHSALLYAESAVTFMQATLPNTNKTT